MGNLEDGFKLIYRSSALCQHLFIIALAGFLPACAPQSQSLYSNDACYALTTGTTGKSFTELLAEDYRLGCITRETYEANLQPAAPRASTPPQTASTAGAQGRGDEIPLQFVGRAMYLAVRINSTLTIPFILDTGAEELVIPEDVATTLARAGALDQSDLLNPGQAMYANGSTQTVPRVVIREVQVGAHAARNVPAMISPDAGEPLLGQSVLARFGTVQIDYQRHLLILSR